MSNDLREMFDNRKDLGRLNEELRNAEEFTGSFSKIENEGQYICEVESRAFKGKEGEIVVYPHFKKTKTGGMQVVMSLRNVVDTEHVKVGATIVAGVNLIPPPTSDEAKRRQFFGFAKHNLGALLGHKDIQLNNFDWLMSNLGVTTKINEQGETVIATDHKMKSRVKISIKREFYESAVKPNVSSYDKVDPDFTPFSVAIPEKEVSSNGQQSTSSVESGSSAASPSQAQRPSVDDNDLPF